MSQFEFLLPGLCGSSAQFLMTGVDPTRT